ncbi:MAG: hypothetical protein IPL83_11165 [Bdellovibrionales bacterium]|nr:hypothetical protein [Bdellovibrionales bacterium]
MARHLSRSDSGSQFPLVGFRSGWLLFSVGLTFAFVVAFLLKTILSPAQIRYWIEESLDSADLPVRIEFSKARIEFSRSWLPWLGLVIDEVSVQSSDACQSLSEFRSEYVRIPLSPAALISKKVHFSSLNFGNSQLKYLPGNCFSQKEYDPLDSQNILDQGAGKRSSQSNNQADQMGEIGQVAEKGSEPGDRMVSSVGELAKKKSFFSLVDSSSKNFPLDPVSIKVVAQKYAQGLQKWEEQVVSVLDSISVPRLEFIDGRGSEWTVIVQNAHFAWKNLGKRQGLQASGGIVIDAGTVSSNAAGPVTRPLAFHIFLAPDLSQVEISGNYKEGLLRWNAEVDWLSLTTQISLDQKQIPLNPVLNFFKDRRFISEDIQPKYLWLNCHLAYSGEILDLETKPLRLESCFMRGDMGSVNILEGSWYPWRTPMFDPLRIDLKDLDLQKTLEALQRTGPSGIFSRFGLLDGQLIYESSQEVKFSGEIRDLELSFSNRGVRGKQPVKSLKGELILKKERISGNLFDMQLEGGDFKGQLTFNVDRDFRSGAIQMAIDRLEFNKSIQNLMVGGEISRLSAFGQARVENGDVSFWRGDVGIAEIKGSGWRLQGIKMKTDFVNNSFSSLVRAKKISFPADERFYQAFRPLFLDELNFDDGVGLSDVSGKMQLSRNSGSWEKVRASAPGKIVLSSNGKWDDSRRLTGDIVVDFPKIKKMRWEVAGSLDYVQVRPSAAMLQLLSERRPELKKPDTVEFIRSSELLVKEISEQGVEKFKSLGKKVMETARRIVPEDTANKKLDVTGDQGQKNQSGTDGKK